MTGSRHPPITEAPAPQQDAPAQRWTRLGTLWREDLNFLLTNRVPRAALTRFMGWFSRIRQPLVRDLSMALWKRFGGLDLSDSRKRQFDSLHDCFTRQLRDGARPFDPDPDVITSPCDGIVGAFGPVDGDLLLQAKGMPYRLSELFGGAADTADYQGGSYVTLRLSSAMYHRFHAPHDCQVRQVTYISGDTFNVNPISVERIERLFCRNERALIRCRLAAEGPVLMLVPVAAILVASIQLNFLDEPLHLRYQGPNPIECDARFRKGEELGYFQHGSTILVFAPKGFELLDEIVTGNTIRAGTALLRRPLGACR